MRVIARKIEDLDKDVGEILESLDWKSIIDRNDSVVVKPNFLTRPRRGVTTDLKLLSCVVEKVKERTGNVVVGETDSTGRDFDRVLEKLDLGCRAVNLSKDKTRVVKGEYGTYRLPELALNSKIVNIPVLKTHVLTRVSFALKNLFGLIPDREKEPYHWGIDKLLCDLYHIFKPDINILDATHCMDKKGPVEGRVRKTDYILASNDALALDLAACKLIGLDPVEVSHLKLMRERDYEWMGDPISLNFEVPSVSRGEKINALLQHYPLTRKIIQHPLAKRIMRVVERVHK